MSGRLCDLFWKWEKDDDSTQRRNVVKKNAKGYGNVVSHTKVVVGEKGGSQTRPTVLCCYASALILKPSSMGSK
jgi:hypothetical protein